ncbi:uncharacterized protein B0H64DRAFT_391294 [Chaetomium fimeti]|uniref:Uncharacterized protein n=1 Tax=Chaetomium fimeti TaxID=1854472 RepID=A0AAE0HI94_9PEZI|nr:hypothetical protein B0H64DRAFT_391294 [Chaetomium fimeti]
MTDFPTPWLSDDEGASRQSRRRPTLERTFRAPQIPQPCPSSRRRATAEYPRPSTSTMPEMRFWCGLGRMAMQQPKLYWPLLPWDFLPTRCSSDATGPDGLSPASSRLDRAAFSDDSTKQFLHRAVCALRHSSPGLQDRELCLLPIQCQFHERALSVWMMIEFSTGEFWVVTSMVVTHACIEKKKDTVDSLSPNMRPETISKPRANN